MTICFVDSKELEKKRTTMSERIYEPPILHNFILEPERKKVEGS